MNTQKETKKKVKPVKVILQWLLIIAAVFIFFEVKNAILDTNEPKQTANNYEKEIEKAQETVEKKEDKTTEAQVTGIDSFIFSSFASGISGKTFMKDVTATGDKGVITFYNDYASYMKANPNSLITDEEYQSYFTTGDGLEKTLFEATSYLFNKVPEMNQLSVTLPFAEKVYSYDVSREQIKSFIGKDKSNDSVRKDFMKNFVSIE